MTCYVCGRPTDQIIDGYSQCDDCYWLGMKVVGWIVLIVIVAVMAMKVFFWK